MLQTISKNEKDYHFLEVWLDYCTDSDESFVSSLISQYQERLILLFRRKNLETIHMDKAKKEMIIKLLNKKKSFLDLDSATQKNELSFIKKHNLSITLITSYHNYQETPTNEKLHETITDMETYHPTIYKVSTKCNSEEDALRLLTLQIDLKKQNKHCIVLGMGEQGSITRIFGTLWGNEMIFAPQSMAEASAPGQLTKDQLEQIFIILGKDQGLTKR